MKTTTNKARALYIAINLVSATVATGGAANQGVTVPPARVVAESIQRFVERPVVKEEQGQAPKQTQLRRLRGGEMSVQLVRKASEIIKKHHMKPFGTDIAFDMNGKSYVGRIERHYHPPGGELRPWGEHPGCSLFVVETASEVDDGMGN